MPSWRAFEDHQLAAGGHGPEGLGLGGPEVELDPVLAGGVVDVDAVPDEGGGGLAVGEPLDFEGGGVHERAWEWFIGVYKTVPGSHHKILGKPVVVVRARHEDHPPSSAHSGVRSTPVTVIVTKTASRARIITTANQNLPFSDNPPNNSLIHSPYATSNRF
ncbi:MAG: hypothetical protein U0X20_29785 [Caldilineaceae bacterium]